MNIFCQIITHSLTGLPKTSNICWGQFHIFDNKIVIPVFKVSDNSCVSCLFFDYLSFLIKKRCLICSYG